ncbi:hypothetical protein ACJX0J_026219, partial [Zea mays]
MSSVLSGLRFLHWPQVNGQQRGWGWPLSASPPLGRVKEGMLRFKMFQAWLLFDSFTEFSFPNHTEQNCNARMNLVVVGPG